ncbi:MAG TPA: hypothetical protein PL009_09870 [Flavipsychrobacter sp.]|nr:hypothetical protein [Flavipsychrobacter sp.]
MKLGKLLLLAGAALAANQFLKTSKGKQLKKDVSDKAGVWKEKLTEMVNKNTDGRHTDSDKNPTGNSWSGTSSPM